MLRAEVEAIAAAARAAGVTIVSGDTKVVGRGQADQMYVCTTGIGRLDDRARAVARRAARPATGSSSAGRSALHGTAIMLARGEFELGAEVESDTRPLWPAVDAMLDGPPAPACAACATPRAAASPRSSTSWRARPASRCSCARRPCRCRPSVAGAAELLGIDPMHVANEGVLVAVVAPEHAEAALAALRAAGAPGEFGEAAEIGEVKTEPGGVVLVETAFGGKRVMDQLVGDPLPRIC